MDDKCYICLSQFDKQTVASLQNCQHVFCLDCLLQWSQTSNTCPVDRISFSFIYQRRRVGGSVQKKIKVRTQRKDDDDDNEEEVSEAVVCEECGRSDRRHRLLVCSRCDSGFHMNCLTPSLNTEPEGDWVCPECEAVAPQPTDIFTLEEEISDGELTDLLAEVDETASTSSRLRPSTSGRQSGDADRRRSARLRSRSDNNHHEPQPQTSLHVPKYLIRASRPSVRTDEAASMSRSSDSGLNSQNK